MTKICLVGMVSWCDSSRFPQRLKVFKKATESIRKYIPKDICLTAIVDNNSSDDVKKIIEKSSVFDVKILLPDNIHDVGAYAILRQVAKDNKLEYLWLLENDYVLFRGGVLDQALKFLNSHKECGYLRTQKFDFTHQERYSKEDRKGLKFDKQNSVWLKNILTNKLLKWSPPHKFNDSVFYINNWHFGLHGGLIHEEVWDKIFPKLNSQVPYYYRLETYMRKKYQSLRLKTGVLDKGVFSMESESVYQKTYNFPFVNDVNRLIKGEKGGYIDGKMIKYYQQNYSQYLPIQIQLFSNSLESEELNALKEVFSSRWLGYGSKSKEFEKKFAEMIGTKYALGLSSCTAGLFMSMDMLGIKRGDEVIIPSVGFIACANAVIKTGAKPVFADVDKKYLNILPSEIEKLISSKTKAVMVLHYGGIPCEINRIKKILEKQKRKIYLIEDSANSIKSLYHGNYCGALGDIGVFSLDVNKVITTGTGGMMTFNSDDLFAKAIAMRFYGLKPTTSSGYDALKAKKERWWEIELEYPGNRYICNDITSAIALKQMNKLDLFIKKRKRVWDIYNRRLKDIVQINLPPLPPKSTTSSYYFYWIQLKNEDKQLSLAHYLVKNGIYTTFRYYPLHLIKYYKYKGKLPNSEVISKTTLNLPIHQNLTDSDLDRIIFTIRDWAKRN